MQLSENFNLAEFEKSSTATRLEIPNKIPRAYIPNVQELVHNVLQPVRNEFGPVVITSGYRSKLLNEKVGGSKRSEHMQAKAADFYVPTVPLIEVAEWIRDNCEFNQLILEFGQWIHCSYSHNNKKQVLTAKKVGGKTVYKIGLCQ